MIEPTAPNKIRTLHPRILVPPIEVKNMMIYSKDPSSRLLSHDPADINSLHVIMPMRVA
jgi:hypothetical protein